MLGGDEEDADSEMEHQEERFRGYGAISANAKLESPIAQTIESQHAFNAASFYEAAFFLRRARAKVCGGDACVRVDKSLYR